MAKKHPTSSRVHRDSDVPDDAFVGTIRRVIDWVQDHQREATMGTVAVLVVAAGSWWFIASQRAVEANAQTRFTQVRQTLASGNTQLAIRDLQSFLDTYGSTDVADQARITLADLLLSQEQPQQALDALGSLPGRLDEPFGLAGARLAASALERMERYDDAFQSYVDIADNARFDFVRREALDDAARVQLQHGDPEQAVDVLDRLLQTFEEDAAGRGYYEMMLAEARARARTGRGATSVPASDPMADTDTTASG